MKNTVESKKGGTIRNGGCTEEMPLYNSRIIKVYTGYVSKHYPDIDIDELLSLADITNYAVEDQAHWFTQEQVDRFHQILVEKTQNPNISREAGRYAVSSGNMGAAQQYTLGLMGLSYVYVLMEKLYPLMSRGADIKASTLRGNRVQVVAKPASNVHEKPYQCENRIGTFESLSKLFTNTFADVEHPECIHRGDDHCRYIISWKPTSTMRLKQIRNLSFLVGLALLCVLLFFTPFHIFILASLCTTVGLLGLSLCAANVEKKELMHTISAQGNAARDLLDEIEIRHSNSSLVQEIGQTLSKTMDINELTQTVVETMVKKTKFDRSLIMLANPEKDHLIYQAGSGYSEEQEALLKQTRFTLGNPNSKGPFVLAFNNHSPYLVEDMSKSIDQLSPRSQELVRQLSVKSLICAPILYKDNALGILAVDNKIRKKRIDESDLHLLIGISSQTAVGIVNANYFNQLKASEKQYRHLVESAKSIILRTDGHGIITFVNEFAGRVFGYKEPEILGKDILSTIHHFSKSKDWNLKTLVDVFQANPKQRIVTEDEYEINKDQQTWISWTYTPILDDDGRLQELLCIGNDITELKLASREKRSLSERLQRAEKMEAIGTLAGGVAHDLNNILAGIVTYPQAMMMRLTPDESKFKKPFESIIAAGEKASAIVQDLLTLARRGVVKMEPIDLNSIVIEFMKGVIYTNLRLRHTQVTFKNRLGRKALHILGSPAHLTKVIMNLITNAAEAMPDGGSLFVRSTHRRLTEILHGFEAIPPGKYAVVSVEDTGIGIPPDQQGRIFEPFYTNKVMARSGTGLGMAVVWGTVKDHGGYIDFQSEVGNGTTFDIYFPLTNRQPKQLCPFNISEFMGNGETILVVDDVKEQRDIASDMLSQLGYQVATARNGRAAEEYLLENNVNLLLLDMIMESDCDGLDTYKRILRLHPKQKAVIASGFSETRRVKEAQKLGAGPYIRKPYTLEQLAIAIKNEI